MARMVFLPLPLSSTMIHTCVRHGLVMYDKGDPLPHSLFSFPLTFSLALSFRDSRLTFGNGPNAWSKNNQRRVRFAFTQRHCRIILYPPPTDDPTSQEVTLSLCPSGGSCHIPVLLAVSRSVTPDFSSS